MRSLITRLFDKTFRRKNRKERKDAVESCSSSVEHDVIEKEIEEKATRIECEVNEVPPMQKVVIKDCFEDEQLMEFLDLSRSTPIRAEEFEQAKSAAIYDDAGAIMAKQTIIKYTNNQAYCVVSELSPKVAGKAVKIAEDGDRSKLKLVSIETERENRRLLPIFVQFHTVPEARTPEGHLTDVLAEDVLGRMNLELKKNVTLDSFAHSDSWRDDAGFIVTDRNRFEFATFDSAKLLSTLLPSADANIVAYTVDDLDALCDFDNTVCGFNREQALEFLAANASVFVAKSDSGIDGMIAAQGSKVLALYAETMEIAHALLKHYVQKNRLIQVELFTRCDVWECEASSRRPVYRRHTRSVPACIKWAKVYAINMGVHII